MKTRYSFSTLLFLILSLTGFYAQGPNVTATAVNCTCPGSCNGGGTTVVSGGTTPYTYSWSPSGGTGSSATGLCAGTYTVKVTDYTGLSQSKTITVTAPSAFTISMFPSSPGCFGASTGSEYATVSGGTGPYTYSWSPVAGTSSVLSNIPAGNYTLHVTDANGCAASQTGSVTNPAQVVATATSTNVTCTGYANGTANATASGGDNSFSYSWSPSGGANPSATGLAPGTYTCHVNDGMGCPATASVTITQPATALTYTVNQTNCSCYGTSDGSGTIVPSGGTAPYSYSWNSTGSTAPTASNLGMGTYTCFINDANGCYATPETLSISSPAPLSAYVSSQMNVLCNGGNTGTLTVMPSGGTSPYTYSWSPSGGTAVTASGLGAGTYTCAIKDSHGCPTNTTGTISQPGPIVFAPSMTQATCGNSNGSASLGNVAGGTSPYTYSWSPVASSTASVTAVPYGTYTATVTDNYGCIKSTTITVTNTGAPSVTTSPSNITCYGTASGACSSTVTGGTAPYTYSWSPSGGTASTASSLAAGTYTVLVKDANGCMANATATLVDPPVLAGTISTVNVACNGGSTGSATITASGGTPSYVYNWTPSGGTSTTASGLSAGTYTCTIGDAQGCTKAVTTTITQHTAITATFTSVNPVCYGGNTGTATISASGGASNYTYSWTPSGGTSYTAMGLSALTYTCKVTDMAGCFYTFTVTLTNPAPLIGNVTNADVTCNGLCNGSSAMTASGGTAPYVYSWSPSGGTGASASGLCAGTYTCFVNDANGCGTVVGATITQPAVLTNTITTVNTSCGGVCTGSMSGATAGGTTPYSYSWMPGNQSTAVVSNVCSGTYTCSLTDAHGCTVSGPATVGALISPTISGTVTAPVSGNINSGWAYLVQYDSILKRQHIVDSVAISNGKYKFINSIGTKLLVYAVANKVTYPNVFKTYSKHAVMWDSAAIVNAPCGTIDTANIVMYELAPTTGGGTLAGFVIAGNGYVPRHFITNPGVQAPGDPIPGLDVNLEQHPGGIVVAHTTTDTTGKYHFGNVPAGNYAIWVDIPGLGMTRQYLRTIITTEMYKNLDYRVDSAHIRPDSTLGTGIIPYSTPTHSLRVSPNPFNDGLTVNYSLQSPGDVSIEVYNLLGERLVSILHNREDSGDHSYLLKTSEHHLGQGTYILRMTMGGIIYTEKIVCIP
ncbi:MAG: T9SS type A sorting domain-containing protein [Bacteroidia bacterium]